MPSIILNTALRVLGGVYRFPGDRIAPAEAELDLPLQFVHDVSREAERARGVYLELKQTLNPNAGVTQRVAYPIRSLFSTYGDELRDAGLQLGGSEVWLLSAVAMVESASNNLDRAIVGFISGGTGVEGDDAQVILFVNEVIGTAIIAGGALITADSGGGAGGRIMPVLPLPFRLNTSIGSNISQVVVSGGGGQTVLNFYYWLWVGPLGTSPPGME